jgi:hypothetical protein
VTILDVLRTIAEVEGEEVVVLSPGPLRLAVNEIDARAAQALLNRDILEMAEDDLLRNAIMQRLLDAMLAAAENIPEGTKLDGSWTFVREDTLVQKLLMTWWWMIFLGSLRDEEDMGLDEDKPELHDLYSSGVKWFKDGDTFFIVLDDFVDLQQSPAVVVRCPNHELCSPHAPNIDPPSDGSFVFTCKNCGERFAPDLSPARGSQGGTVEQGSTGPQVGQGEVGTQGRGRLDL